MIRFMLFSLFVIVIVFIIVPFISKKYAQYKEKRKQKELEKQKQEEDSRPIGFTISKQ